MPPPSSGPYPKVGPPNEAIPLRTVCQITVELKYFIDHPWPEERDTILPTKLGPNTNHMALGNIT